MGDQKLSERKIEQQKRKIGQCLHSFNQVKDMTGREVIGIS
jgi:hypothetical protein